MPASFDVQTSSLPLFACFSLQHHVQETTLKALLLGAPRRELHEARERREHVDGLVGAAARRHGVVGLERHGGGRVGSPVTPAPPAAPWRGCVRPLEVREGSVGAAAGAGAPCLRDGCPARRPGQLRSAFRAHELYWLRTHEAIDGEMRQLKRR